MPKASIDGTQMPIKIAAFASPLKYNISEKIRERNAEINNNLSVVVNFLNMVLFFYYLLMLNCGAFLNLPFHYSGHSTG
jgi:hypothetical protein